jgi:hypothetical protein
MNQFVVFEPSTSTTSSVVVQTPSVEMKRTVVNKNVEDAVLQYIKAIRRLGQTSVSTHDIAGALGLPHQTVLAAARNLKDHGVKGL